MTRTAPRPAHLDVTPQVAARWPVALVWDLAANVARSLAGNAPSDPPVTVEVRLTPADEPERANVEAAFILRSGAKRVLNRFESLETHWRTDEKFEHVDCPAALVCTHRLEPDATTLLYARSPLLERLGIPAGAYALQRVHA